MEKLLNDRKVSALDEDGQGKIPLHIACAKGHYEMARVLLQEQSGLNSRLEVIYVSKLWFLCKLKGTKEILTY